MNKEIEIITKTRKWIEKFVIGLILCPFARQPFAADKIGYQVSRVNCISDGVCEVLEYLKCMDSERSIISNAFIIFDCTFSFEDMLFLKEQVDVELEFEGMDRFQSVVFHRDFCFAGSNADDSGNFPNRSPYPMLHLLRTEEVSAAIHYFKGIHNLPYRNLRILRALDIHDVEEVFRSDFDERCSSALKLNKDEDSLLFNFHKVNNN